METVYFYDTKINKDVTKTLKEDEFMRISYVIRDSKLLGSKKTGNYIYINATPEEIELIDKRFKDLNLEKIVGEEMKTIIDAINSEGDDAASGMGMIFG